MSGTVAENIFAPQTRTLRLRLTDIQSGREIEASDVEVQAGRGQVIKISRSAAGDYRATIPYTRHIRILVIAAGRTATMLLKQE